MKKVVVLVGMLAFILACTTKKESENTSPNFIIIMADDLGYGDLSSYGNTAIHTPHIDSLAAGGIRFTDFHSNGSVCSPTRAALMTGKYQQRTGIEGVVTAKNHRDVGLGLTEITIAEELQQYNYNCGMYGKWHLGYPKEYNPTLQGFDAFTGFVSGNVDYHAHIDQEGYLDWWKGDTLDNEAGYLTDLITNYGVQYLKENNPQTTNRPFFLYLPHGAPHSPYQKRLDRMLRTVGKPGTMPVNKDSIAAIYKEMVEVMDQGVGKIVRTLKELGQYENTMIIFLSDNGANPNGNNGGLRGFKAGVYEGGSRVPAIVHYPKEIKKGRVNDQTLLTMDLLPTVLDFIDKKPSGKNIDGLSIKDHILQGTPLPERDVFYAFRNRSFVRSANWKLVRIPDGKDFKTELYDLSNDLQENKDLSKELPEMVITLGAKLEQWEKNVWEDVNVVAK